MAVFVSATGPLAWYLFRNEPTEFGIPLVSLALIAGLTTVKDKELLFFPLTLVLEFRDGVLIRNLGKAMQASRRACAARSVRQVG
jgi:hypothetical protein